MIIGVDFDNTIVSYEAIFHRAAFERGLIPLDVPVSKTEVRDYLRRVGREPEWTELQGVVYGSRMSEADVFPGVKKFFQECRSRGIDVKIVSHKTRFPFMGGKHDLHAAALAWLEKQGFFAPDEIGLARESVFFELTKDEKLRRIESANCTHFIDDLPEILTAPGFPEAVTRILFDPPGSVSNGAAPRCAVARSWTEISELVFGSGIPLEISAAAETLLGRSGIEIVGMQRLVGGGNNRVYQLHAVDHRSFLVKQYFHALDDRRDRFAAERAFYNFALAAGVSQIPKTLGWEPSSRIGIFEFVEGVKPSTEQIGEKEIDQVLAFFRLLNPPERLQLGVKLPVASEACFSVREHLDAVDARVARLGNIPVASPVDVEAKQFVSEQLQPLWQAVRASAAAELGGEATADSVLPARARCVSPSDFGFHNCLRRRDGSLIFFDFEYAGWDDPAKTVCDFFCQPALPAPQDAFEFFATEVGQALGLRAISEFVARCRALLPVYRVKWCGILLNEFMPGDNQRRAFARGADATGDRKVNQLNTVRRFLDLARETGRTRAEQVNSKLLSTL